MESPLLIILASAVAASLLTVVLAFYLFDRWYKKRLERELDERVDAYRRLFHEEFERHGERLGALIEERVRKGIVDGVAALPSPETLRETTRTVARTGVDLMEAGLGALLSGKRPKR